MTFDRNSDTVIPHRYTANRPLYPLIIDVTNLLSEKKVIAF